MKEAAYSEQEVRRWLGWLARGMQKHGQSVFLIERLQPDWLPDSRQRWSYLLLTRLLQSSVFILLLEVIELPIAPTMEIAVTILTTGLSVALGEGILRKQRRETVAFTVFALWLLAANRSCDFFAHKFLATELHSYIAGSVTVILGIRSVRGFEDDIQSTESLAWSWRGFLNGLVFGKFLKIAFGREEAESGRGGRRSGEIQAWAARVGLGFYCWIAVFNIGRGLDRHSLPLLYPNLLIGMFTAISRRAIEMKVEPNEGMRRSLRTSLQFLLMCSMPWVTGLLIGIVNGFNKDSPLVRPLVQLILQFGTLYMQVAFFGVIFAISAAAWFGGMDVIAHYSLRVMLYANGSAPMNYPRFLDYAATELGFLQKVGGGYMFMHRHLLEYFAGGGDEAVAEGGEKDASLTRL